MPTTITFVVQDDLTPAQADKLAGIAKSYVSDLAYCEGGMAAEVDRRIETDRINDEGLTEAMNGKPVSAELAQRWFREALLHVPHVFRALRGAWLNLRPEDRDLGLIDAAAEHWPAIANHKQQIAAVLSDPMWPRKTARSAEIDGHMILAEDFIEGIAINPAHPPRDGVGEQFRDDFEMSFWWGRPFIFQNDPDRDYIVECLDGGAWDRPTQWGVSPTVAGAMEIVRSRME